MRVKNLICSSSDVPMAEKESELALLLDLGTFDVNIRERSGMVVCTQQNGVRAWEGFWVGKVKDQKTVRICIFYTGPRVSLRFVCGFTVHTAHIRPGRNLDP